jgi:hypothetical protein
LNHPIYIKMYTQVDQAGHTDLINGPHIGNTSMLHVPLETLATRENVSNWSHLKDLNLPSIDCSPRVMLLIGQDVLEALLPIQVRKGQAGEPYATKTLLGWTLNGPLGDGGGTASCNFLAADPRRQN